MSIKVGQVGVGAWGRFHLALMSKMPAIDLMGIYQTHPGRDHADRSDFDAPLFDDLDVLLESVDAVVITASTSAHHAIARQALVREKHVFVEKPICATLSEADELIDLARERGLVLQVGHIERFNPAFRAVADLNLRPWCVEVQRAAPFSPRGTDVSVVFDLMIHDLDLLLSFVDSPIKEVTATGRALLSGTTDFANALVVFENGCVANLSASRVSRARVRQMRIVEQKRVFELDFIERSAYRCDLDGTATQSAGVCLTDAEKANSENLLHSELLTFANSVRAGSEAVVDGYAARRALALAATIEAATRTA